MQLQRYQVRHHLVLSTPRAPVVRFVTKAVAQQACKLPAQIVSGIKAANQQWLEESLKHPLTDIDTGAKLYLVGCCPYAPFQWEGLRTVVDRVHPSKIVIDQPSDAAAQVLLPHPAWIQTFLDFFDIIVTRETLDPCIDHEMDADIIEELLSQLQAQALSHAKVGKDVMDPFETFGYYPGLDFVTQPTHVVAVLKHFGYLAGMEYVAAAQLAQTRGAELACIDAPIKLQEQWVSQLVQQFQLHENQLAMQLLKDYDANEAVLDPACRQWDQQLASKHSPTSTTAVANGAALESSSQETAILAYKLSRACAAAHLSPQATVTALQHLQRLQPLKFQHFALREKHMAWRLRELCTAGCSTPTAGPSHGSGPADKARGDSAQTEHAAQPSTSTDDKTHGDNKNCFVVLLGRQYVPGLRNLWNNKNSVLWQDKMPREFHASVVEAQIST
eukprot:jgi/Chrzof1/1934/Cz10g27010.t1